MNSPQTDHMLVGVAVAFDAETGHVLHVYEKFVETIDGEPGCATEVTTRDCEETRASAARTYPRRRVDVIAAPPETVPSEEEVGSLRYRVDPMTRELHVERECDARTRAGILNERFSAR